MVNTETGSHISREEFLGLEMLPPIITTSHVCSPFWILREVPTLPPWHH